ncbi:MAG: hypothetical protein AABX37_03595 [Nanoarchaeota archaeon]
MGIIKKLGGVALAGYLLGSCHAVTNHAVTNLPPEDQREFEFVFERGKTGSTTYDSIANIKSATFVYSGWGPPATTALEVKVLERATPDNLAELLQRMGVEVKSGDLVRVREGDILQYVQRFMPSSPIYSI